MRAILTFGVTTALCLALFGCGAEKFRDPVYEPSDTQMEFADACSRAMVRNNVKFAHGARRLEGCACMADKLETHGADPDDAAFYGLAGEAMRVLARAEKKDLSDEAYAAAISGLITPGQATARDIEQLMTRMGQAFAYCGQHDARQRDREKKMCETMTMAEKREEAARQKKYGLKFDVRTCSISKLDA